MPSRDKRDMKIAVIGCGSIGRRHIKNLQGLGAGRILACDNDPDRVKSVAAECGVQGLISFSKTLSERPDAVLICTPPSSHLPLACEAAEAGCHLFIEKPLSHNFDGLEDLLKKTAEAELVTLIGCNFKFHPSFLKLKEILESGVIGKVLSSRCQFGQYLPDWHPWEDYRTSYSARDELGGGILLDSHEFDYITWFLGEVDEIFCLSGRLSDLEIETEDTAEVVLRFKTGAVAEIHLDYVQRAYQRTYEFFAERGTLKWDFNDHRVWLYQAEKKKWDVFEEPRNYDLNDMYIDEMRHFLDCVQTGKRPVTDIHSGYSILRLIMAAKASAREGRIKKLSEEN